MKVTQMWHSTWFSETPLINLSVSRVIIVATQLIVLIVGYGWYMEAHTLPSELYDPLPVLDGILSPFGEGYRPSFSALLSIYGVTVIAGVFGLAGAFTNTSLFLFALGNIVLTGYRYSFGDIHHPDALMMVALFVLALSPSGKVLSIDHWWRTKGEGEVDDTNSWLRLRTEMLTDESKYAWWPLLLIQVLIALIYLDAGLSKIEEGGIDWVNGYTLQYYLAQDAIRWGRDLALWVSQHHLLIEALSWVVVLFESTFFLAVMYRPVSYLYLPLGVGIHIGIYVLMAAPFFQLVALYAVFVPWAKLFQTSVLSPGRRVREVGGYEARVH